MNLEASVLKGIFSRFKRLRVLVMGDLICDRYLTGQMERISPEAPSPIIDVTGDTESLGGAGNAIRNMRVYGSAVSIVGVVGKDGTGRRLVRLLRDNGVTIRKIIQEKGRKTSLKTRMMVDQRLVSRFDVESRDPLSPSIEKRLRSALQGSLGRYDLILLSDYAKGGLTPSLVQWVIREARRHRVPVVVDPKGSDYRKYRGATAMTPNRREMEIFLGMALNTPSRLEKAGRKLLGELALHSLLITLGRNGMLLLERGRRPLPLRSRTREVFDVTGAGDTVAAVFGLGLAAGLGTDQAAQLANDAAEIVVGKVGTAVASPREISAKASGFSHKLVSLTELQTLLRDEREAGKKVVLTNGCFDLLHDGHLKLLEQARQLGDLLVVAVNRDRSARGLKGAGRPILNEQQRASLLAGLGSVDYVTLFGDPTPARLIRKLRPDVLVKGNDYVLSEIVGADLVRSYGGKVKRVGRLPGRSSTDLIRRIRAGSDRALLKPVRS